MQLQDLLRHIFEFSEEANLELCVLRNYDALPHNNIGNDIDLFFPAATLDMAHQIFRGLNGVVMTGCCDRYYVLSVYLHGVEWGKNERTIQIDFFRHLVWKGIAYLEEKDVLTMSKPLRADCEWLKIPSRHHEAIISFFSSYLVGGWVKDRYQDDVRHTFSSEREKVRATLGTSFNPTLAMELVGAVERNDRSYMQKLLPRLRFTLASRAIRSSPFSSLKSIVHYFLKEIYILYSKGLSFDVCVLGPDGSGKTTVIQSKTNAIKNVAKYIDVQHLRPAFLGERKYCAPVIDPHALKPRAYAASTLKLVYFLIIYLADRWLSLNKRRNFVLHVWDRYYHDMLADPRRYRMGAPAWLVRLFGHLIPKPDLFLILDVQPEVARARKTEVSEAESQRQFHAYRALAEELPNAVLIDANGSPEDVASACERAVVEAMAYRLAQRMGWNRTEVGSS